MRLVTTRLDVNPPAIRAAAKLCRCSRWGWLALLLVLAGLIGCGGPFAEAVARGDQYAASGLWDEAAAAYGRALRSIQKHLDLTPGDGRALTLGAGCLARLDRTDEAIQWSERALAIDGDDPVIVYAAACVDAILGRVEEALTGLERALELGFGNRRWILNDPDFEFLRNHPRFRELVGSEDAVVG